jgi:hypothetical protein
MILTWATVEAGWICGDYRCDKIERDYAGRWRWQAFYKDEPIAPVQCLMRSSRAAEAHAKENANADG